MTHVTLLMCTRNGAGYLGEQLESFAGQSHRDWSLWISDDGSSDSTVEIAAGFRDPAGRPPRIVPGPQQGFAANFLSLTCHPDLPEGYVAFSDQDDVWFPEKLDRGLAALAALDPGRPALACGRTLLTDAALRPIRPSRLHRHFAFRNALVQNVVAGNTIILNPAAHRLIRDAGVAPVPYHDWWCYLMVTGAGGQVVYDPRPCMYYRQHPGHVLGENRSAAAVMRRAVSFGSRRWRGWFEANLAALQDRRHLLAEEVQGLLDGHTVQTAGPLGRARALAAMRAYRQRPLETAALYAGSLVGLA